jgi:SAM-dependent methyltransferase
LHLAGDFDRYIGIDQSEAMIEAARALTHDLPEAAFVHANVKSEDLPVGVADLVLLVGALHHMTDIGDVIQSLTRLAKPGADFVAIEPHRGNPIIQAMRWLRVRIDREYSGDQHFFIKPELGQILADGGLTDVELSYRSFLTQPFAQVILPDRRTGEDTVSNARTVVASLFIGRRMSSRPRSRPNAPSALVPKSEALASSATFARHFLPLLLRTQFTPMNSNGYSFDF